MRTLSISLPDDLTAIVEEHIARGSFASADEYVCGLILADQRRRGQAELETFLLGRLESAGPAVEMNAGDWEGMRKDLLGRLAAGKSE